MYLCVLETMVAFAIQSHYGHWKKKDKILYREIYINPHSDGSMLWSVSLVEQ